MAKEKMVEGHLRKYFEEVVLLEQKFVLSDSKNIKVSLIRTINNLKKHLSPDGSFHWFLYSN
jgi:translation elongation factor EF-Ts